MIRKDKDKRILLFGGSGLVGSRIIKLLNNRFQIIAPPHMKVDVTQRAQVDKIIEQVLPDHIIYAVGLTSVDKAEENSKLAYLLNTKAPTMVAEKASQLHIPILYFSTDAVFDGTKSISPYEESDKTNPISMYGKSKLLGEQMVLALSDKNCVVRIITVYSHVTTEKRGFVQAVLEALSKGEKFQGITDQIINPIYVDDIVKAIYLLINSKSFGIYHLGATDYITNYNFIRKLAKHLSLDEKLIEGITFKEFFKNKLAKRTKYCWLDTSLFRKEFGENVLHTVDESIMLFKKNLKRPS